MKLVSLVALACIFTSEALAFPGGAPQRGVRIPPAQRIGYLGPKVIPDRAHPYRAPRKGDLRGPCPGMNSMANHGYINRNGVDTFENMVFASQEAWALGKEFAEMVVGYSVLVRGNPFLNLLSIGGESPLVPPMPGRVDGGQRPGGLSQHNRFEGDNSQVHDDFAINGDPITFNATKFERLVHFTRLYGDKNGTVANRRAISEFKYDNHVISQTENPNYNLDFNRMNLAYNEIALTAELFPNGTTGELTMEIAENFFKRNTFTPNWSRRATQFTFPEAGATVGEIRALHPGPVIAGRYVNGVYTAYDVPSPSLGAACDIYTGMMDNVPADYLNTTGLFRENVDFLLDRIHNVFFTTQGCAKQLPRGPSRT